jgi:hypothetical protein
VAQGSHGGKTSTALQALDRRTRAAGMPLVRQPVAVMEMGVRYTAHPAVACRCALEGCTGELIKDLTVNGLSSHGRCSRNAGGRNWHALS